MRNLLVLLVMVGGCSSSALPGAVVADGCNWNISTPATTGYVAAVFDYTQRSGCIGPTPASTDFGFNIEIPEGSKFTRFDFGVSGFPAEGTVIDLSTHHLFASANGWACSDFAGTATIESSALDRWRVDFDATCRNGSGAFVGTVDGNTEHGTFR